MKRSKLSLIGVVLLLNMLWFLPMGYTQPCDFPPSNGSGGARTISNPVRLLVAMDEEFVSGTYYFEPISYNMDARTYVENQLARATYYFPWDFTIIRFETWDSDDSYSVGRMLGEVINELEWFNVVKNMDCDVLVAFTKQNIGGQPGGSAYLGGYAMIVRQQTWWADDNVLISEFTHLFGVEDHCSSSDCVMSVKQKYWYFYDEPLYPIRSGIWTTAIFNTQMVGYMSYDWCNYHKQIVWSNIPAGSIEMQSLTEDFIESGEIIPIDDGPIHEHPSINPTEGLNPPMYTRPDFIAVVVVAVIGIVVLIVIAWKRRKH